MYIAQHIFIRNSVRNFDVKCSSWHNFINQINNALIIIPEDNMFNGW